LSAPGRVHFCECDLTFSRYMDTKQRKKERNEWALSVNRMWWKLWDKDCSPRKLV
jgi:hypothetical protein